MPLNHGKFQKQEDSYAFEEDSSSESLSPEQQLSDETGPSSEALASSSSSPALTSPPTQGGAHRDLPDHSSEEALSSNASRPVTVPSIVKSKSCEKSRHKKAKDVKPKVKKLKYHQYIPPDQKMEKSPPPMDSAYARLLQQQQLYLQLQILSQQKHSTHSQSTAQPAFSYHPHPQPHPHPQNKGNAETCSSSCPSSNSSSPVKNSFSNQITVSPVKPGPLPANLDDLKVSELRQHLRMRGMPVSGTKTALIERLRPFKDANAGSSPSSCSDITTVTFPITPTGSLSSYQSPSSSLSHGGYYPYPSTSSSPPVSPASSDLSLSGSLPDHMSSPTHFTLPLSPSPPPHPSPNADKDQMLVEKQKVIEELTWKLHQEQKQVEELRMQLHKRKRCYGGSQDRGPALPHPSVLHQGTSSAMMGQHFFGVTIKQEPQSFPPNCPLSSPEQVNRPPDNCMEDMGHCTMGGTMGCPSGAHGMETGTISGSPPTMSAFLSPQNSPLGKPSSSPPTSPNSPYLLPLGRDGCSHPHNQGSLRTRSSSMQLKGLHGSCSYDHGLQGGFTNSESKPENIHLKMSVPHVDQKCPTFSSYHSRLPPRYEDAIKQQLTRSQQMDELLDVLIESGGCPGLLVPRFTRHYEQLAPPQLAYDQSANHSAENHLENLLSAPIGRNSEEHERKREDSYSSSHNCSTCPPQPPHQDTPLSPLSGKAPFALPEVQGMVSMAFSDAAWETMEWLDLTPPTSTFSVAPPTAPSIFNTEFLDVTDMNLNSTMDLHLDHW